MLEYLKKLRMNQSGSQQQQIVMQQSKFLIVGSFLIKKQLTGFATIFKKEIQILLRIPLFKNSLPLNKKNNNQFKKRLERKKQEIFDKMQKQLTLLTCSNKKHNIDEKIDFLYISEKGKINNQILMCQSCILEQNISTSDLISLLECERADDNAVIRNWPPQIGQDLIQKIISLTQESKKKFLNKKIEEYFTSIEASIKEKIDLKKKEILSKFENYQLDSQNLITLYNRIAEKKQLKQILNDHNQNNQELNKKLSEFFEKMRSKSNQNVKEVLNWIDTYQTQENKIQFDQAESIKNITEKLIENINFIFENIEMDKEEQDIELKLEQMNESYLVNFFINFQQKNTEVKKKYLNCLQEFENQTMKINKQFNDINEDMKKKYNHQSNEQLSKINNMIQEFKQKIDIFQVLSYDNFALEEENKEKNDQFDEIMKVVQQLNKLKMNQVIDIQNLSQKIALLTENSPQDYLEKPEIDPNILPKTKTIQNISEMIYPFIGSNKEKLQKILKQYPIFELSEIKTYNPIKFTMVQSAYSQSSSFSITKEINCVHIFSNNNQGTVYSDFVFDNSKKYIVRFKFNLPFYQMNSLQIGLIRGNNLNTDVSSSQAYLYYSNQSGLEIATNNWLYGTFGPQHEQINEIEMRVCINENTLIFTDYPNYKTQNSKKPKEESSQKMDDTQEWRIGVNMSGSPGTNKVVTINQFVEVEEFPQQQ